MTTESTDEVYGSLARRLAALLYDALIVLALWMLTGAVVLIFTDGEAVPAGTIWFRCLLLAVTALFFTGFWTRGGQTLGMRAWRLKLVDQGGEPPGWGVAAVRFAAACLSLAALGLGFLAAVFDDRSRAWHDRVAGTRVLLLPKRSRRRRGA